MEKQQLEMLKKLAENLEWKEGPPPKDGNRYEVKIGKHGVMDCLQIVRSSKADNLFSVTINASRILVYDHEIIAHRPSIREDEAFLLAALNDATAELESPQQSPFAELKEYTPPHGHDLSKLRVGESIVLIPNVADMGGRFEATLIAIDGDAMVVEIYKEPGVIFLDDGDGFVHARIPLHKIDAIGQAPKAS